MSTTTLRRIVLTSIAAGAAVATMAGFAGIASASTLPSNAPTTAMTITNDTNNTLWFVGSRNPDGSWIAAPHNLAPHQTETVTAMSNNTTPIFPVNAAFAIGTTGDVAHFDSVNSYMGDSTDSTKVTGPTGIDYDHGLQAQIVTGAPALNASYILAPMTD